MADDIRIGIVVTGNKDVVTAINSANQLEASVRKLAATYDRGGISEAKAAKGAEQLAKKYKVTVSEITAYGLSTLKAIDADRKAQASAAALKAELQALTIARKEAAQQAKVDAAARAQSQKQMDSIWALAAQKEKALADQAKAAAKKVSDAEKEKVRVIKAEVQALTLARREAADMNRRFDADAKATAANLAREAAATASLAMEKERLSSKFISGHAAATIYANEIRDISLALSQNIITLDEEAAAVARLKVNMAAGTGAFASLARGAQAGGRAVSRSGVMTQQFGYQMGDFLVQVQGGTNWMVAFGQQATQMVGAFNYLPQTLLQSTKAIFGLRISVMALIASAGILIPLITAIGAFWMRSREATNKAKDGVDKLDASLKSLRGTLDDWIQSKKASSMGITVEEMLGVEGLSAATKRVEEAKAKVAGLQSSFASIYTLSSGGSSYGVESQVVGYLTRIVRQAMATKDLTVATNELAAAQALLNDLGSKNRTGQSDNSVEYSRTLAEQFRMQREVTQFGEDSAEVRKLAAQQEVDSYNAAIDARVALFELEATAGENIKAHYAEYVRLRDIQKERLILQEKQDEVGGLKERTELAKTEARYGKESVEYKAQAAAFDLAAFILAKERAHYSDTELANAVAAYKAMTASEKAAVDVGKAFASWSGKIASASSALSGVLGKVRSIFAEIGSVNFDTIRIKAETAALNAGMGASQSSIEGKLAQKSAELGFVPVAMRNALMIPLRSSLESNAAAQSGLDAENERISDLAGGTSGSGSGATDGSNYDKLLKEQALRKEMLTLSGQEKTIREEIAAVTSALGEESSKLTAAQIQAIAQVNLALAEQEEIQKQAQENIQSIANTMQSSMGDAFMSMVDGTKSFKDAMKDMARTVIKQLYEVLVVQRLVGSFDKAAGTGSGLVGGIMKLFGQADGGAWSGGSQIKAYANGGVVGGPTMFPMSGGKTGLMGEAGPEAIMPLKRGANGKLGVQVEGSRGSGSVVIHQSFNFSANGDDSVKRIIAQAAPQIALMTQKQIMDSRRRGGSMKSTFG
jgi:hypothetical protein